MIALHFLPNIVPSISPLFHSYYIILYQTKDAFLGRSGEAAAALAGGGIAQGTGSQHKEGHKTKKKSAPGE